MSGASELRREKPPKPKAAKARARARRPGKSLLRLTKEEKEARLLAAVVLEVLAGARTPSDAAASLGVSVARYYALETRALEGLLSACKRRPKGRQPSSARQLAKLRKELERLERECARSQALLRAAQRAVGLRRASAADPAKGAGKKRRRRRPTVRALRAAKILRSAGDESPGREDTAEREAEGPGESAAR